MVGPTTSTSTASAADHAAAPVEAYLFTPRQAVVQGIWVAAWVAVLIAFWVWWIGSVEGKSAVRFWLNTIAVAWVTFLPLYFFSFVVRAREMRGPVALPAGSRVAMVVTKAPSEPWPVVRRTLEAMLAQDYPHDTWLADEDPTVETKRWCAEHGVRISTRKGVADYHRPDWPRRTRCKEGNLAYFYDHYGYDGYDFVVQMDADHVPQQGYLREMLKPFADPSVGYVSAPSICDANARTSWSARGRLYAESTLHGLLQAGYMAGWSPLCIGSHYAVRTAALKQIGGLGPELAEDHSTTLLFNAHQWRGAHAFRAIASGDGPQTFADMLTQEFQWARSLTTISLSLTPSHWKKLNKWQRFQFAFSQGWYPLFTGMMLLMYIMPIYGLASGIPYVELPLIDYYAHFVWFAVLGLLLARVWKTSGLLRPHDAKIVSWEAGLFLLARWPYALMGVIWAIKDWLVGNVSEFRVTPKGHRSDTPLPLKIIAPYIILSAISSGVALTVGDARDAQGFYWFCAWQGLLYALVASVAWLAHMRENEISLKLAARENLGAGLCAPLAIVMLLLAPAGVIQLHSAAVYEGVLWGTERYNLTEVRHPVSGAGSDGRAIRSIRLRLPWS